MSMVIRKVGCFLALEKNFKMTAQPKKFVILFPPKNYSLCLDLAKPISNTVILYKDGIHKSREKHL